MYSLVMVAGTRYWPKLFWGAAPLYFLELFVYNILIMFFVVANLDSAVWGTRYAHSALASQQRSLASKECM